MYAKFKRIEPVSTNATELGEKGIKDRINEFYQ